MSQLGIIISGWRHNWKFNELFTCTKLFVVYVLSNYAQKLLHKFNITYIIWLTYLHEKYNKYKKLKLENVLQYI